MQLAQSSDNASQGLLSVRVEKDCAVGSLANGASLIGQTRATCSEMPDADDIDFVTAHPYSCVVSLVAKGQLCFSFLEVSITVISIYTSSMPPQCALIFIEMESQILD